MSALLDALRVIDDLRQAAAGDPLLSWVFRKVAGGLGFAILLVALAVAPLAPFFFPALLTYLLSVLLGLTFWAAVAASTAAGIGAVWWLTAWQLSWFEHEDATRQNMGALGLVGVLGMLWGGLTAEVVWRVLLDTGFWMQDAHRWLAAFPYFVSVPLSVIADAFPTLSLFASLCADVTLIMLAGWGAATGLAFWIEGAALAFMWSGEGKRVKQAREQDQP